MIERARFRDQYAHKGCLVGPEIARVFVDVACRDSHAALFLMV